MFPHLVIVPLLIRMRRPIVPVRIRRRVVQITVQRATLQPVVRVASDMGERRVNITYIVILFHHYHARLKLVDPHIHQLLYIEKVIL